MTEDVKPALTADEWASDDFGNAERSGQWVYAANGFSGIVVGWKNKMSGICLGEDILPAVMAVANAALPDDSPCKITRDDVALIHETWEGDRGYMNADKLRRLSAKLAALLPPEP